jgi:enamidase
METLLYNIGDMLSGKLESPKINADSIVIDEDRIVSIGKEPLKDRHLSIDCKGMTLAPGLVDTHVHPTIGDFGTKQQSVGYLERMVHGAVTHAVSAGEVHVPGRVGADSAVAIALAAHYSYKKFGPLGIKVHGGGLLLENDTEIKHIDQAFEGGVRIIGEVGIGSLKDPKRAGELSTYARELGMVVHMHCGATSDRGAGGEEHPYFSADDVLTVRPSIASHANSFVSLSDEDVDLVCDHKEGPPFIEIVQAGGVRSMLRVVEKLMDRGDLDRLLIGTDTPTGYGVTSLGIIKTLGDICSMTGLSPDVAWAIASGNAARAFNLEGHKIIEGAPADLVLIDASLGSPQKSALDALAAGEFIGVALVITDGKIRVNGSQCTLRSKRVASIKEI